MIDHRSKCYDMEGSVKAKWLLTFSPWVLASSVHAQDCSSVIALSKLRSSTASSVAEVQSHAAKFCSEYSRNRSDSNTSSAAASYKFLSASFSSGSASVDEVASKYCSAQN